MKDVRKKAIVGNGCKENVPDTQTARTSTTRLNKVSLRRRVGRSREDKVEAGNQKEEVGLSAVTLDDNTLAQIVLTNVNRSSNGTHETAVEAVRHRVIVPAVAVAEILKDQSPVPVVVRATDHPEKVHKAEAAPGTVSYTHLTLPTIYSV